MCGHFCVLYVLNVGALRIFSELWYHKVANGNMGLKVVLNSVQGTVQERNCVRVLSACTFIFNYGTVLKWKNTCMCMLRCDSHPQCT